MANKCSEPASRHVAAVEITQVDSAVSEVSLYLVAMLSEQAKEAT
ncbi:hypothetical protein [Mycobacteroides abscessus]|nr:hypothetical protein [Mycobacteroides abscessus]